VVLNFRYPSLARAVGTTEEGTFGFNAVPDDLAATVTTDGGKLMNRALEAVEGMLGASRNNIEG
jgi:hypothetical protein